MMTAVVAWLALAISCASFVWQIQSWVRSGAVLVVHLCSTKHPAKGGPGGYAIVVINEGRLATSVHEADLFVHGGLYDPYPYPNPYAGTSYLISRDDAHAAMESWKSDKIGTVPIRIEPGEEAVVAWYWENAIDWWTARIGIPFYMLVDVRVRASGRMISSAEPGMPRIVDPEKLVKRE